MRERENKRIALFVETFLVLLLVSVVVQSDDDDDEVR